MLFFRNKQMKSSGSKGRGWWPAVDNIAEEKKKDYPQAVKVFWNNLLCSDVYEVLSIPNSMKDNPPILDYSLIPSVKTFIPVPMVMPTREDRLVIDFDVYKSEGYRKTTLEPPHWRLSICRFRDPPPSSLEIDHLVALSDPVPLKFCIVQNGTVSYCEYSACSSGFDNKTG